MGGGSFPSGKFTLLGALEAGWLVTEAAIAVFMTLGKWIITQRVPTKLAFMKHATHLSNGSLGVFH